MQMNLREFFELWPLFGDATLTGAFAGMTLGVLGVHVILRRMVFLTAAISHTASLGVILAVLLSGSLGVLGILLTPTVGALLMTLATLLVVHQARQGTRDFSDATLGALYLLGAAGTLALFAKVQMELHDLNAMLFGTAVAVLKKDFYSVAALSVAVVAIQGWFWRGFTAATTDGRDAQIRGLPVRSLDLVLMLSIALVISVSTRVLGPLPTFAFSILPALAAIRCASNMPSALRLAGSFGAFMGFGGYVCATLLDLPVGAAQALLGLVIVVLADAFTRLRSLFQGRSSVPASLESHADRNRT